MDELISVVEKLFYDYDKFILCDDKKILCIKWEDYESEYHFINKVKTRINELDKYPQKIIYNGKEIILVV